MMYCEKCRVAFGEGSCCPVCGNVDVRIPLPEDICFLTDADPISAGMLKAALEQNSIPFLSNSSIGAGLAMRAGAMFERVRFHVRFDDLQKAKEIADTMFGANEPPQKGE